MDYKEFQDIMSSMDYASYKLECAYTENEGEVTEETEMLEAEITALRTLLNTDGVDFLGRWLKGKEDKKKAIKAEKDYLTRQIEAIDKNIEFIKAKIRELMDATGCEKVKGALGYTFATTNSKKTEVDKQMLEDWYMPDIQNALTEIGIPDWVTVKLDAKVSEVPEGTELPAVFKVTETPTIRFTKPRGNKE